MQEPLVAIFALYIFYDSSLFSAGLPRQYHYIPLLRKLEYEKLNWENVTAIEGIQSK